MARKKILPLIEPGKAERVERDRARLMKLFVGADENKIDFIQDAVQQVAWLGITIKELQADIDQNGPVLPYDNGGNQKGLQVNPACKLLKDYQESYNTLFRALLPLVPEKAKQGGKLTAFVLDDLDTEDI